MKIGLVLDRFDPAAGGLERWTEGLARFLLSHGCAPHVLAFEAMADPAVPVHLLPPARGVLGRARAAAAAVAALKADIVLDTGTGWSGDVFMPCTGSRQWSQRRLVATHPPLMRLRAALSPRSIALDWALGRLEREQVRRARHVIAVSALVRDMLVRRHGPLPVSVVPNGVATARFADLAPLRAAARAALGVRDEVLFLGSAHNPWLKGMDVAIRAVARTEGAVLAIAGSAGDARLQRLAAPGQVRFLGAVADMTPVFAAADALVHPTRWDACSLSTIEAGAAGLPVITTARNGAAALITEGVTGFVLQDPEDVVGLSLRMSWLMDAGRRERMGHAARSASAGHDVAVSYASVLDICRQVAGRAQ